MTKYTPPARPWAEVQDLTNHIFGHYPSKYHFLLVGASVEFKLTAYWYRYLCTFTTPVYSVQVEF